MVVYNCKFEVFLITHKYAHSTPRLSPKKLFRLDVRKLIVNNEQTSHKFGKHYVNYVNMVCTTSLKYIEQDLVKHVASNTFHMYKWCKLQPWLKPH